LESDSKKIQFCFLSRTFFTPNFFILILLGNLSIFITFFPPYPIQLTLNNIRNFLVFFSLNLIIFVFFPYLTLKKDFETIAIKLNETRITNSLNQKIIGVISLNLMISLIIFFFIIEFFNFSFQNYNIYFWIFGFFIGILIGLTISSYLLKIIIIERTNYRNLLNFTTDKNYFIITKQKFPLLALFEIEKDGNIQNHSVTRIFLFVFYSTMIWIFLFFIMNFAIENSINNSFQIIINDILLLGGIPQSFSLSSNLEILNIFIKQGIHGDFNFQILMFLIYIPILMIFFIIHTFQIHSSMAKHEFNWLRNVDSSFKIEQKG